MARPAPLRARIRVDQQDVAYTLYRVPRRRHVHLVVSDDGELEVRAPYRFSAEEAEDAVRAQAAWALGALARARAARKTRPPLETGSILPLLDERLRLEIVAGCEQGVIRDDDRLLVRSESNAQTAVKPLLEHWYHGQAQIYLPSRLYRLGAELGVKPTRVTVRGQKSRWGSCSSKGALSINWRLMLVPSALADYVLVHELCHLRHLDHSAQFWDMVATHITDYPQRRARLRTMQAGLAL